MLPSLNASDVHQTDLASLYAGEARAVGEDEPETARVKGSAAMATLLAKALAARTTGREAISSCPSARSA